jgi:hypothetical protein
MAAAALIVAILALIVSALSAWAARQQARTEQDRRLSERTPEISARLYESSDPGQSWVLDLLLQHDTPSGPLAEITAVISRFTDGEGNSYPPARCTWGAADQEQGSCAVRQASGHVRDSTPCTPRDGQRPTASPGRCSQANQHNGGRNSTRLPDGLPDSTSK